MKAISVIIAKIKAGTAQQERSLSLVFSNAVGKVYAKIISDASSKTLAGRLTTPSLPSILTSFLQECVFRFNDGSVDAQRAALKQWKKIPYLGQILK